MAHSRTFIVLFAVLTLISVSSARKPCIDKCNRAFIKCATKNPLDLGKCSTERRKCLKACECKKKCRQDFKTCTNFPTGSGCDGKCRELCKETRKVCLSKCWPFVIIDQENRSAFALLATSEAVGVIRARESRNKINWLICSFIRIRPWFSVEEKQIFVQR